MVSPAPQIQSNSKSGGLRYFWRAAGVLFLLLVLAGTGGAYWFYSTARRSLPQLDGTISLSGLKAPVTVVYDEHGVPNITAASLEDLFYAQGYVTAQDRLWGMDMYRRYAAGELSAALGPAYVQRDIYQRTLGLRQVAERAVAALSPRDRSYFEAYARGVNAYIADHQYSLPPEFRVLRYFPRAWTVEDSFLVGASLAEALNHGYYRAELDREKILARLGPELTNDLYVNNSFREIPPGGDQKEIRGDQKSGEMDPDEQGSAALPNLALPAWPLAEADQLISALSENELRPGSNGWAISGAHTVSGKPILSNDMHLGHRMPNIWYEAHLTSGEYDVVGVTLPGMPFVIVGHNRRIAWGITNLGADVEDTFVETFNSQGQYLTPKGWEEPEHRHETIRVIRGQDVDVDVIVTRHGPIITNLLNAETESNKRHGGPESRMIALQSVTWSAEHAMTYPFFDINVAGNWQEFRAALSKFIVPSENFMYADVDGHIGYQATGTIPIRASGTGVLPVNGSDGAHEWAGYIPFEKLPSVLDPPSGILATANSRISPDEYPFVLSTEWVAPYRTERIYKLLRQDKKLSPADMLGIQTDIFSDLDRFIAQRLVYATDHARNPSERTKKAAEILRKWDGRLTIDSSAAAIVRMSREQLEEILLRGKLGNEYKLYNWQMSEVWLENVLLLQPARWLAHGYDNFDELLSGALQKAVDDPRAPRNLDSWRYGEQYPIELRHMLFGQIPIVLRWSGPGVQPQSGDGTTVKQVGRMFGPSERMTVDLSSLDNSTLNIVNGQSGHLMSPYFDDQWNAWYEGTTFPLPFSETAVKLAGKHRLELKPASRN